MDNISPTAWIVANRFLNENQKPIEFTKHRFLIDPFDDMSADIVVRKSAQVGFSVLAILKSFWLAKYRGMNTIYVLPTQDIVKSFVNPKVDPLISSNPVLNNMVGKDSVTLKKIGERFIHYKGSSSQREAISTSADLLCIDEYDRCISMEVLNTYDSRLQASDIAWRWRFSNPSAVGFGVDKLFDDSNQYHWFIKCHHCGHRWYIDFEADGRCHFIDKERQIYACGKCLKEISNEDRQDGEWVARWQNRTRHGYWFSQMMCPWVSARRILEQYAESSPDFFYNFVLGKAYTPSDLIVNRVTILRANAPSIINKLDVVMGVDQDVGGQYWVAMTPQGVFAHGKSKSWEEVESLKLQWNATVVCDPNPYPTMPKLLATKYKDWYLCYFKESQTLDILQWKDRVVFADRTRLLDVVAKEITDAKLLFREHPHALEDLIGHWENIYRTTVEKDDGKMKSTWLKKDQKQSDYPFALAYARIAMTKVLSASGSGFVEPEGAIKSTVTDTITPDGRYQTTLNAAVEETFAQMYE